VRLVAGADLSVQLLGSIRARPRRLLEAGYEFEHPTVREQLDAAFA
jgi:NAD dependent epimerase/dehydratase family enzyme